MRGPVPRQHALRTGRHHGACSGAPTATPAPAPSPEPRVPDSDPVPCGGGTVLGPHVSEEPFTPACSTPVPSSLGSSRDPAPSEAAGTRMERGRLPRPPRAHAPQPNRGLAAWGQGWPRGQWSGHLSRGRSLELLSGWENSSTTCLCRAGTRRRASAARRSPGPRGAAGRRGHAA